MKLKRYIPTIKKSKVWDGDYLPLKGCIQVWHSGNNNSWIKPPIFKIGFSGSMNDPYSTLHIYIGKIDIWFMRNPLKKLMTWNDERLLDKELLKGDERCPHCGSHRLRVGNGMAYEPIGYCKDCGAIIWESDPEPYIR